MFKGVFTAVVTPFTREDTLDEAAFRALIRFQVENGVQGIVPVGTTGESPTLTFEEHCRVIELAVEETRGRVPVIAGAGSNSTAEAIELTAFAKQAGAAASLQVAPYYNKPTADGFFRHFTAIADKVDLPLVVYNIPGRTGKNIENETMLELAKHKNIVAVKEASGNITQVMDLIRAKPKNFGVLSGDDNLTLPLMALGADGVISVASNLIPAQMAALVQQAAAGKWNEARAMHYALLPLFQAIFIETNPIPIKAALAMKGMAEETYRLPLCPLQPAHREKLKSVLDEMKLL